MGKKQKVIFTSIIIVLALAVVGLLGYILGSKKKDNNPTTEVTTTLTTEASTEAAEATVSDAVDATSTNSKKSSSHPETAAYATISAGDGWQNGDKYVKQFSVDIHNDSSSDLKDWKVKVSDFGASSLGDCWNAKLDLSASTLTCTAVDYNETLAAKSVTNFGFQAEFDSQDAANIDYSAILYIDGKEYTEKREEVTTQSEEEKEASKAPKKDAESGTPLANHGKLSVKGTDIVDKNGDPYQLKGVSTHGLQWFPEYVNKDSFQSFRDDFCANVIRLAMYTAEGGYCEGGDQAALKQTVNDGVSYATDLGMYVIIDWHILHDTNPLDHEDEAIAFFDEMSAKYADYDNVLFEICNEPNGSTSWSDVKSYAEDVIPVIRKNAKDAIIIVGTPTWSQDVDLAAKDPITGQENICYTCHFYAATHKDNIRDKVKAAHEAGLCVFISEFSICDASGNGSIDYDSADAWMKLIDEYNMSYCAWNISNKDESSSLIKSGCDKTSGWTDDDLSETGLWLKSTIKGE